MTDIGVGVLQEFVDAARHGAEYFHGRHVDPASHEEARREWLRDFGFRRTTVAARTRAVEVTRQWRRRQLATPATAAEYRAKRAQHERNRRARLRGIR